MNTSARSPSGSAIAQIGAARQSMRCA
jgi:hypothetical protein